MIDVGSEWRTFSNEKNSIDPSRVGGTIKHYYDLISKNNFIHIIKFK